LNARRRGSVDLIVMAWTRADEEWGVGIPRIEFPVPDVGENRATAPF